MEQITEEFAKILITSIFAYYPDDTIIGWVKNWKEKGYIKQSREDKIRQKIKSINNGYVPVSLEDFLEDVIELIKILDSKIEELQNER